MLNESGFCLGFEGIGKILGCNFCLGVTVGMCTLFKHGSFCSVVHLFFFFV